MLDAIVFVILAIAIVYFISVLTEKKPTKKGPKRDSKGRFTK